MPINVYEASVREVLRQAEGGCLLRYRAPGDEILVARVGGTPRQIGRQYGMLLGDRIRRTADRMAGMFAAAGIPPALLGDILDNAWQRLRPHAPERFLEEMDAIAEGARDAGFDLGPEDLWRITTVTNFDLYKREERIFEFLSAEAAETLQRAMGAMPPAMSCTMFAAWGSRTVDGKMFSTRNLDWVAQTGMHEDRLVTVCRPEGRYAFASAGYAGVIGCLSGMNEKGITLSEVGSFSVREQLDGIPWTFMARQVLEESDSLEDAVRLVTGARHTIGYNYLVADGDPENAGTPRFQPRAAAFETNHACCEVFYEDDPKEHAAAWIDPEGGARPYGLPMTEAIMRADMAFGAQTRALQATDNGPAAPENDGNPLGREGVETTYCRYHRPMHDMIRAYESGHEYVFPVRGVKVIESGLPRKIGTAEAMTIAATVAHNVELLSEQDWNVMSVVYAPTDLEFWAAFESCDAGGNWLNAPDSGYWHFNLSELLHE
jgi:hypothetical protein